ncbi:hypothetical protein ES332_D08G190800v1 [Gossypium tomentosum]|uniref:Uncharacterized protein n=1 Tax=Gossypium tomentosum TaxID=34277 RepID=A0A5D2JZ02_GOSTO|nr:hypothetical protein ES332_D08G190800v1 [Gossypium tomentosum]
MDILHLLTLHLIKDCTWETPSLKRRTAEIKGCFFAWFFLLFSESKSFPSSFLLLFMFNGTNLLHFKVS